MTSVISKKADWIEDRIVSFDPGNNSVTLGSNRKLINEYLIVASGPMFVLAGGSVYFFFVWIFGTLLGTF